MTYKRLRAVALLAMALAPAPAMAEEAIVDGIRFVVPAGTGFFMPPPNAGIVRAEDVQIVLDKNRAAGPRREGARTLFMSLAVPDKPGIAVLVEPPANHPGSVLRDKWRAIPRTDGVANVPSELAPAGDKPARRYLVATGLDYAPDAMLTCGRRRGADEYCTMTLTLDGRLRLAMNDFPIDETSHDGIRRSVVAAVTGTLPDGMRKH